jgi:hypothetical protein
MELQAPDQHQSPIEPKKGPNSMFQNLMSMVTSATDVSTTYAHLEKPGKGSVHPMTQASM